MITLLQRRLSSICLAAIIANSVAQPTQTPTAAGNVELDINGKTAPFLFDLSDEKLVETVFPDVAKAQDEFTKRDLYQKYKPIALEEKSRVRGAATYTFIDNNMKLGDYDFDRGGFPILENGYAEWGRVIEGNIHVTSYSDAIDLKFISVPVDKAKTFASDLAVSRVCTVIYRSPTVRAFVTNVGIKGMTLEPDSLAVQLGSREVARKSQAGPYPVIPEFPVNSWLNDPRFSAYARSLVGRKGFIAQVFAARADGKGPDKGRPKGRVRVAVTTSTVTLVITDLEKSIEAGDILTNLKGPAPFPDVEGYHGNPRDLWLPVMK